jgi:type IV pilus assembly protein PilC
MHSPVFETLKVFGLIVGTMVAYVVLCLLMGMAGLGVGLFGSLLLLFAIIWAAFAYMRYREGRQEELLQLVVACVEGRMPLVPALRAYLHERPERGRFWGDAGLVVCMVLVPLAPYYIWLRRRRFDRRVEQFAEQLERGASLSRALRAVPNVLPREARLAAIVGEATGTLAECLRRADRERLASAWIEVGPRLIYPFVILLVVLGILSFLSVNIIPKFKKIFAEFGSELPGPTRELFDAFDQYAEYAFLVPLTELALVFFAAVLIAVPTVRWYTPLIGRLYRWDVRGQVLRLLSQPLEVGRTVPESLRFLGEAYELPPVVRRRLAKAAGLVECGEPLADALRWSGLLSRSMVPLVAAAERARTLPWALRELGEHLGGRAFRVVRRASLLIAPVLVVAVGALVGYIAYAMFIPLIELISGQVG